LTNQSARRNLEIYSKYEKWIFSKDLFIVNFVDVLCFTPQDNAELFAMMEKTRMYIFRNLDPEVLLYHNK